MGRGRNCAWILVPNCYIFKDCPCHIDDVNIILLNEPGGNLILKEVKKYSPWNNTDRYKSNS